MTSGHASSVRAAAVSSVGDRKLRRLCTERSMTGPHGRSGFGQSRRVHRAWLVGTEHDLCLSRPRSVACAGRLKRVAARTTVTELRRTRGTQLMADPRHTARGSRVRARIAGGRRLQSPATPRSQRIRKGARSNGSGGLVRGRCAVIRLGAVKHEAEGREADTVGDQREADEQRQGGHADLRA